MSLEASRLAVGVVGCGVMGTGIAIVAARAGARTIIHDVDANRAATARAQIDRFLARSVRLGKMSEADHAACLARVELGATLKDMAECDLVIEAVFESPQHKAELFSELDKACGPATLLASNTSTLSITELGAASGRPDRFIGIHFCLPPQLMRLVEVTTGLDTAEATLKRAWSICEAMGQLPIATKDTPGFILNHFVIPLNNDAIRLVQRGVAEPAEIDRAMRTALGLPLGPLQLVDMVGLDTQILLSESLFGITGDSRAACPMLLRRMVAAGRLGKKCGRGFYDYQSSGIFGA